MDWDRSRRFDDHRGGESYRPAGSRGYIRRSRSPSRIHSPRLVADTWVPSNRTYGRARSRSPALRRRSSRSPPFYSRDTVMGPYSKTSSPTRRYSPRREGRNRSPPQLLWQSRSPYGGEMARGRSTPRRLREPSPPGQDFRQPRRERPSLPTDKYAKAELSVRDGSGRMPPLPRPRSPLHPTRRERVSDIVTFQKRLSPSARGDPSPMRTSASGSLPNSRRSSPINERPGTFPHQIRDRSPSHCTPSRCHSKHSDLSNRRDARVRPKDKASLEEAKPMLPAIEQANITERRNPDRADMRRSFDTAEISQTPVLYSGNVPTQPKAYNSMPTQAPPSGPSHGLKALPQQIRGSSISLLSAPTRPRGGANFKENPWTASTARRGGLSAGLHGAPPTGPRSSLSATGSVVESNRPSSGRQSSVTGITHSRLQRFSSQLSGLRAVIPEGKPLPLGLDASIEKRLSLLETDRDRLVEQATDNQRLNRLGARDWDRLDRESSICALKSELAEGHLQRISDSDSMHIGMTF
ncbi:uncharacterized protein BO97DRAFT_400405 [Aspergillus homomorphus CBS 101889]|uniref:Serine/arginine repetitive matrix protein 1 n=1 Tax=Aspergillus homomorphus (strain CBS 101889) TaxID=1450537 RepID=A0A395HIK3_ASPHC|nr:hypothetical protein BO97DRAFT_400405 [Aspergillus homomorphus CBS 101889]RAL07329.1 hypothetical protein BO97DRAFT_400405 [Aspergillus homomorphus CBS 101889]